MKIENREKMIQEKITQPLTDAELAAWKRSALDDLHTMGLIYQVVDPLRAIHEIQQRRRVDVAHGCRYNCAGCPNCQGIKNDLPIGEV